MVKTTLKNKATLKYLDLAQQLRAQIASGVWSRGERLPSLVAMRQDYGASRPTVEKAFALLAREGLIEQAHGTSAIVATPGKRRAGVIGLCGNGFFRDGASWYWSQLLAGINAGTSQAGAQILLLDEKKREGWENVDGILLSGWAEDDFLPHIPAQMPLVSLMVPVPGKAGVWADEYSGARAATEHLINLGHRKIAFLHGPLCFMKERIRGYKDALNASGGRFSKAWQRETSNVNQPDTSYFQIGRRDMNNWLRDASAQGWNRIGCTALLCQNDAIAAGAMQALREAGIHVPREVSVIGFDGTDMCELVSPALTTIALPLLEIGSAAVELLLRQIQADCVWPESRVLPIQLQVRQSTAAPAALI